MIPGLDLPNYGGIRVVASQAIPKEAFSPKRKHVRKLWMRLAYHNRIQKKWTKRFGVEITIPFYVIDGVAFTHPDNAKILAESSAKGWI